VSRTLVKVSLLQWNLPLTISVSLNGWVKKYVKNACSRWFWQKVKSWWGKDTDQNISARSLTLLFGGVGIAWSTTTRYTGRWWVGCYVWYSEEGIGRGRSPSSPIFAVPNVIVHPSTASVPIAVLLYNDPLLCGFKGLKCFMCSLCSIGVTIVRSRIRVIFVLDHIVIIIILNFVYYLRGWGLLECILVTTMEYRYNKGMKVKQ